MDDVNKIIKKEHEILANSIVKNYVVGLPFYGNGHKYMCRYCGCEWITGHETRIEEHAQDCPVEIAKRYESSKK